MSIAEIKQAIRNLSTDEWMEVQACLWERAGVPTVQAKTENDQRSGPAVAWDDLRQEILLREESSAD